MPGIKHSISIGAEPHLVYPLVASGQGFTRWWSSDVTEEKPGGNVELGFFKRATIYGLKPKSRTNKPKKARTKAKRSALSKKKK